MPPARGQGSCAAQCVGDPCPSFPFRLVCCVFAYPMNRPRSCPSCSSPHPIHRAGDAGSAGAAAAWIVPPPTTTTGSAAAVDALRGLSVGGLRGSPAGGPPATLSDGPAGGGCPRYGTPIQIGPGAVGLHRSVGLSEDEWAGVVHACPPGGGPSAHGKTSCRLGVGGVRALPGTTGPPPPRPLQHGGSPRGLLCGVVGPGLVALHRPSGWRLSRTQPPPLWVRPPRAALPVGRRVPQEQTR
jgi:hypothetical protein